MSICRRGSRIEESPHLGMAGDFAGKALEPRERATGVDDDGEWFRRSTNEDSGDVVADAEGGALGEGEGDWPAGGETVGEVGDAAGVVLKKKGEGEIGVD